MNDSTEQVLKSWRPRKPSAELRNRIFAAEAAEIETPVREFGFEAAPAMDWAGLFRWLVPAMGCFVLAGGALMESPSPTPSGPLAPISEQYLAFAADSGNRDFIKNSVPAKTLHWTFGRASSSSNGSLVQAVLATNTLFK